MGIIPIIWGCDNHFGIKLLLNLEKTWNVSRETLKKTHFLGKAIGKKIKVCYTNFCVRKEILWEE